MNKTAETLKRKFEFSKREFIDYLHIKKLTKGANEVKKAPFSNSKKPQISFKTFKPTLAKDFQIILNDYMDNLLMTESLLDKGRVSAVLQDKDKVDKNMSKSESVVSSNFNLLTKVWESKNNILGNGFSRFNKATDDKLSFKFDEFDIDEYYESYRGLESDNAELREILNYYITEREQIKSKIIQMEIEQVRKSKDNSIQNINFAKNSDKETSFHKNTQSKNNIQPIRKNANTLANKKIGQSSQTLLNRTKNKEHTFGLEQVSQNKTLAKVSLTDTEKKIKNDREEEIEFYNLLIEEKDNKLKYLASRMATLHVDVHQILKDLQEKVINTFN